MGAYMGAHQGRHHGGTCSRDGRHPRLGNRTNLVWRMLTGSTLQDAPRDTYIAGRRFHQKRDEVSCAHDERCH
jgi:hypothetical protein